METKLSAYQNGLYTQCQSSGGGNFSTQQYITYRHRYGIDQQQGFYNDFKIYTLALTYDKGNNNATLGRRINNRITNMGAIDGIQYERKSG